MKIGDKYKHIKDNNIYEIILVEYIGGDHWFVDLFRPSIKDSEQTYTTILSGELIFKDCIKI